MKFSSHFFSRCVASFFILFIAFVSLTPFVVYAETPVSLPGDVTPTAPPEPTTVPTPPPAPGCRCFCQTNDGTKPVNADPKVKTTPKDCLAVCTGAQGKKAKSTCAYSLDQYPERALQCFTQAQCALPYTGEDKTLKGKVLGLFDSVQPPECPSGMHYCYPNPELAPPLTLNVAIGTLKTTINVGEYINAVYYWMIGAGITFAIVFIMIAGLQYVLGAGGGSAAKTAKKRITDATVGLVLLLSVNLILSTVNPYLIRLQVPKLPMLKTVALLKQNLSCEKMSEKFILTDPDGEEFKDITTKKCGDSAVVKEAKDHSSVIGGSTCDFEKCPTPEESCLGTGVKAKCRKCEDVTFQNKEQPPSSDICGAIQAKLPDETKQRKVNYCFYSHDPSVTVSTGDAIFGGAAFLAAAAVSGPAALVVSATLAASVIDDMRVGTCARMQVNCNEITKCENYDNKPHAKSAIANKDIEGFFLSSLWGDMNLQKLCLANPCNITGGCMLEPSTTVMNNCLPSNMGDATLGGPQDKCPGGCPSGKQCYFDGKTAACSTCEEIVDGNKVGGVGIVPSITVCNQGSQVKDKDFCGYTTSPKANKSFLLGGGSNPTCAHVAIDCAKVQSAAKDEACDAYEDMTVLNTNNNGLIQFGLDNYRIKNGSGNIGLDYICNQDPCGAAAIEGHACVHTTTLEDKNWCK